MSNYALILASGGIDSTACINFYQKIGFEVDLIFFDYGQPSNKKERNSVSSIAEFYKVQVIEVSISSQKAFQDGLIMGRNAFFYFFGLMHFPKSSGIIASGIHKGTSYYDCSKDFINTISKMYDLYSNETIKAGAPFIELNKSELIKYCKSESIPIEKTYSCELGNEQPCNLCMTCKELEHIYAV